MIYICYNSKRFAAVTPKLETYLICETTQMTAQKYTVYSNFQ